jgi:hypothetical protein
MRQVKREIKSMLITFFDIKRIVRKEFSLCSEKRSLNCLSDYMEVQSLVFKLCGLVVTVLGYRSGGPGLIPGTMRKKK